MTEGRQLAAQPSRDREMAFIAAALVLYTALALVKMRGYAIEGRFWAEEGTMFYADFYDRSWIDRLFYLVYRHLMLPANIVVAASMLVPMKLAPLVTTWLSFAMQSIPVVLIAAWRTRLGLSRAGVLAVVVILAGLPQAAEVWANAVNLHFHFSLVAAIIAAASTDRGYPRWTARSLLALSGLSGVPANFLAPVFLGVALVTKDRERWIHFGIIAATAALQGLLLITQSGTTGERSFSLDPRDYWLPIVAQQVLSPLFGMRLGDALATILRRVLDNEAWPFVLAVMCSIPIGLLFVAAWRERSRTFWTLLAASLTLALMSIVASLGEKIELISAAGHGRYFYVPDVLLAILLFSAFGKVRYASVRLVLAVLLVGSLVRVPSRAVGPAWTAAYERAMAEHAADIDIWPVGWKMRNVLLD
jgi:hypothetical protein